MVYLHSRSPDLSSPLVRNNLFAEPDLFSGAADWNRLLSRITELHIRWWSSDRQWNGSDHLLWTLQIWHQQNSKISSLHWLGSFFWLQHDNLSFASEFFCRCVECHVLGVQQFSIGYAPRFHCFHRRICILLLRLHRIIRESKECDEDWQKIFLKVFLSEDCLNSRWHRIVTKCVPFSHKDHRLTIWPNFAIYLPNNWRKTEIIPVSEYLTHL